MPPGHRSDGLPVRPDAATGRSARGARRVRAAARWGLILALAGLPACGAAEDADAPLNPPAPAACAPLDVLAPTLVELLTTDRLPGVRRLVGEVLTDDQITTLLDTVLRLLRGLRPADRDAVLALARDPRIADLLPLLARVVRFVAGDGTPCPPMASAPSENCFHSEVFADLRRLLRVCDGSTLFTALQQVLKAPALPALLGHLGDTLRLPVVQQLLASAEEGALGRRGFTALVCNVLAALIRPDFSVQADLIRPLSGITLLPLDEPPLSSLLADLDALLAPEAEVLPALADVVCCDVYGVSTCDALPANATPLPRDPVFTWLLHALFTGTTLDLPRTLDQLTALAADPALASALEPLAGALAPLVADPDLRRGLVNLLDTLLRPDVAAQVLPEVALLLEAGAVPELLAVVDALLNGCEP